MDQDIRRHFMTVDWLRGGRRGIFCDRQGRGHFSDGPLTLAEMRDFLGPFWVILDPVSEPMTVAEAEEHRFWTPLVEYSHVYGIARREE